VTSNPVTLALRQSNKPKNNWQKKEDVLKNWKKAKKNASKNTLAMTTTIPL
jgi:hypothetical protein